MRNLAAIIARLKGGQYDGAMIIKAEWEKTESGEKTTYEPVILKENRKMLICQAVEKGEALTVSMLLKPKAFTSAQASVALEKNGECSTNHSDAFNGQCYEKANEGCWQCFSDQDILDFVIDVNDTNPIHRSLKPVVPGMMVMEAVLRELRGKYSGLSHLELKFRQAIYALEPINLEIIPDEKSPSAGTVSVEEPKGNPVYISGDFR